VKKPDRKTVIATIGLIAGAACAAAGPPAAKPFDLQNSGAFESRIFQAVEKKLPGDS
jgi:hypothetical protein